VYLDKLFRLAREGGADGALAFDETMLDRAGSINDLLGGFLEEQVAEMPDPASALTVLKAFVSVRGTKRQNTEEEVRAHALTLGRDIPVNAVRDMVLRFVDLRILRDKDDHDRYELLHDALAAKIFEKVTLVEKELLEVRQFIESAHGNYRKRSIPLRAIDLEYIAPYEDKLFLSDELSGFVAHCRADIRSAQQLKRKVNIFSLIGLLLLVAATAYFFYARSTTSRANELGAVALISATTDPTYSFLLAEEADAIERTILVERALINAFYNGPFASEFDGLKPTVSPDGKFIATIGASARGSYLADGKGRYPDQDSTVTVRDLDGRVTAVLNGHAGSVTELGFFGDSKHMFTMSTDSVLRFWDVDGHLMRSVKVESIPDVGACHTIGDRLSFRLHDGADMITWRLYAVDGAVIWQWSGKQKEEGALSFQPLGTDRVVLFFSDHIEVQDLSGAVISSIPGTKAGWFNCFVDPARATFVVFDEQARETVTYSSEGKVVHTARLGATVPKNARIVLMFASRAHYRVVSYLVLGANTHGIVVVDTLGEPISTFPIAPFFRPDVTYANSGDGPLAYPDRIWDTGLLLNLDKGSFESRIADTAAMAMGIPWSSAYELARGQPMAAEFDLRTGKLVHPFSGPTVLSGNAEYLAMLSDVHEVEVAQMSTKLRRYVFRSTDPLVIHNVLDDGSLVLGNGRKRIIVVRDPRIERRLPFNADAVDAYSISGHSRHVATLSGNGHVHLWTESGTLLSTMDTHCDTAAMWVKFAPDSAHIAVLKGNGQLGLYTLAGELVADFRTHVDHRNTENVAAFSADGATLVYAANDSTARVVDMAGREVGRLRGHSGHVLAVGCLAQARGIATGSADSTLRIWTNNAEGYGSAHVVHRSGQITSLEAVADKPYMLAAASDSTWCIADIHGRIVNGADTRRPITHARFAPDRSFIITSHRSVREDSIYMAGEKGGAPRFLYVDRKVSVPRTQLITKDGAVGVDQEERYQYIGISVANKQNVVSGETAQGDIVFSHGLTHLLTLKGRMARFSPDGRYLYYIDEAERLRRVVADPDHVIRLVREQKVFGPIRALRPEEREDLGL